MGRGRKKALFRLEDGGPGTDVCEKPSEEAENPFSLNTKEKGGIDRLEI